MFKKLISTCLLVFLISQSYAQINTPQPSPSASITQKVGLADVKIEYSRPSLKGRKMIGGALVPFGQMWRTGANAIPKITISHEMTMAGNKIPAGSYGIFTIPNPTKWTIVLSKNAEQFGTYSYKAEEDFIKFDAPVTKLLSKVEHFTIEISDFADEKAHLQISWENTSVKFPIQHDANSIVIKEIDEKMAASKVENDTYFDAANYYFSKNMDLEKALTWANKVVDNDKQYWTYHLRAKIAAKLGKCDVAMADYAAGLPLAKKDNDLAYIKNFEKVQKDCMTKK
jgi:hypothetical protein